MGGRHHFEAGVTVVIRLAKQGPGARGARCPAYVPDAHSRAQKKGVCADGA